MPSRRDALKFAGTAGLTAVAGTAAAGRYTVDSDLTNTLAITGSQLDDAIRGVRSDSPLIGLGDTWVRVGNEQGINAVYMAAHAAWESAWGTSSITREKNNIYGWTAYDSCPSGCATEFSSMEACIEYVMPRIRENYLTPGGTYYTSYGPTLRGMNVHYATDDNWKYGIRDVMNSLDDELGGSSPSGWPVYERGDSGRDVYTIQYLLRARSYGLSVDGIYGSETESTVESFQSASGLAVDGIVGPNTWEALIVTVSYGDQSSAVTAVQDQLRYAHGYDIAVDGVFGSGTESAVESFQSSRGLAVDGIVGPDTWQALVA
ncbi:peptidoglycan hydrolase [Halegenticoccus soli]|uniref:peptidoglycan hydrolase n=1 Tax=Halegenticoccus soli TaxID=1985678 RepID=UPI00117AA59C|nr:peptidoglycan-binding protein [Halegenticoccus soli]